MPATAFAFSEFAIFCFSFSDCFALLLLTVTQGAVTTATANMFSSRLELRYFFAVVLLFVSYQRFLVFVWMLVVLFVFVSRDSLTRLFVSSSASSTTTTTTTTTPPTISQLLC
jgi:hypothetical protein